MVEEIMPVKGKLKINNIFILCEIYYWECNHCSRNKWLEML